MIRRPPRSTRTTHSFPTRRSSERSGAYPRPTEPQPAWPRSLLPDHRTATMPGSRASGDLAPPHPSRIVGGLSGPPPIRAVAEYPQGKQHASLRSRVPGPSGPERAGARHDRSEEHTSELQSLMRIPYAVFCLKKKKKNIHTMIGNNTTEKTIKYEQHSITH